MLVGALWLATVSVARAEGPCAEKAACASESSESWIVSRPLRARSPWMDDAPQPTPLHPYQGLHAAAYPLARLGLFAQSQGFSLSRRVVLYDVQGGAVLRLVDGVGLAASYRVLGLDLGFDSDVQSADVEPGIAAPFLALIFDF